MQNRAARFGTNVAPSLTMVEENEKKLKRRERFGLSATDLPSEVCDCLEREREGKGGREGGMCVHIQCIYMYIHYSLFCRIGNEQGWNGLEPAANSRQCACYYVRRHN